MLAAFDAACCAAKGVPLRDPRNPSDPELFHDTVLPVVSVTVTMVLLNESCTCTKPWGTCLRSFFLNFLPVLPFFSAAEPAALAMAYVFALAFFLLATVPLRGPLRVRALVWVRCPRTGRLRR